MKNLFFVLIITAFPSIYGSQASINLESVPDSSATLEKEIANPDTLKMEKTEKSVQNVKPDSVMNKDPLLLIKTRKDTVVLIADKEEVKQGLRNFSAIIKKSRMQGYGGAGGFSNRLVAFNMDPVYNLIRIEPKLSGIVFPTLGDNYDVLAMTGGMGYGGIGHGIRIGGGGFGGSRKYVSNPYKRTSGEKDSTTSLKVSIGWGGFLLEKSFVREYWNFYGGSYIGGGSLKAEKTSSLTGETSAFSGGGFSSRDENASAGFMSVELHSGATYTIVPWLHIGGDFSTMFYYSTNGFEQPNGNSFYGFVPSFGFRIVFGNIG